MGRLHVTWGLPPSVPLAHAPTLTSCAVSWNGTGGRGGGGGSRSSWRWAEPSLEGLVVLTIVLFSMLIGPPLITRAAFSLRLPVQPIMAELRAMLEDARRPWWRRLMSK